MPIRINLKELFSSDSQELTVDKVNFNFNKLLELGIGDVGPKGFPGVQGAHGPIGTVGPTGLRGNAWFVDALTPPSILPDPNDPEYLLEGDFYLNSTTFEVYQWNGTQWLPLFDLTAIISNYLANTPSPFIRGLGSGSPNDNRYILFTNRYDASYPDNNLGSTNNANNDILFLNNFNEDQLTIPDLNFPAGSDAQYTALEKIFVNHSVGATGRFHLELGSLYDANVSIPASTPDYRLSKLNENFKMRFVRTDGSVHPLLDHYNTTLFSMDAFELNPTGQVSNGIFQFQSSRYLGGAPLFSTSTTTYIGSRYGFDEIIGTTSGTVSVDGILFEGTGPNLYGTLGIALRYDINHKNGFTYFPENTGYISNIVASQSYFMLDAYEANDGIYLNHKTIQDGGNIIQLGTTPPRISERVTSEYATYSDFNKYSYHTGIAYSGNKIYTFSGNFNIDFASSLTTTYGYLNKFNIDNPNYPISEMPGAFSKVSGVTDTGAPPASPVCDEIYDTTNIPVGPGVSDIAISGDYMYAVNTHNIRLTGEVSGYSPEALITQFQILKLNSINGIIPERVSRLGRFSKLGSISLGDWPEELNSAYRVQLKGKHAIVATNALHNAFASPTELGSVTGAGPVPTQDYDGKITAININDPYLPKIISSATNRKTLSGAVVRSAMMDIEIIGNTVVTLTWEQQIVSSGNATVRIHTDFFDISELDTAVPSISWMGQSANTFTQSSVDASTYSNIIKRGAITGNKKYIYSAYGNEIKIYSLTDFTTTGTFSLGTCKKNYTQIASFILQNDVSALDPITNLPPSVNIGHVHAGIRDITVLGNSAYVLGTEYNSVSLELESYLYKLDISGISYTVPVPPTQIYRKKIDEIGARLQIIGKHIYIAVHGTSLSSDVDQTSLIAIDFDGTYTGGAHIESLRADAAIISGDIEVGENLKVHGEVNVGGELQTAGSIATGGTFIGLGAVPVGVTVPFAGSNAPKGWLICDGSSLSQTQYPELFSIIGYQYDPALTSFKLPNLKQRIPVGLDAASGFNPLGYTAGSETHTLTKAQIPKHTHKLDNGVDGASFSNSGDHQHSSQTREVESGGGAKYVWSQGWSDGLYYTNPAGDHRHTGNTGDGTTNGLLGQAHNNMQPYIIMNYIIYTGVN